MGAYALKKKFKTLRGKSKHGTNSVLVMLRGGTRK